MTTRLLLVVALVLAAGWASPARAQRIVVSGVPQEVSVTSLPAVTFASPQAVTQSGVWTVQPGNTANTTAWLVTGTGGTFPVTGTFWQATQPVSGTFWQATQPVSGTFWQATQPVSGTVTANIGTYTAVTGNAPFAVSVGVASAECLALNTARKMAIFTNTSTTATISLAESGQAAVLNAGITLEPGAVYNMVPPIVTTGQVNCIASAAATNLSGLEKQ